MRRMFSCVRDVGFMFSRYSVPTYVLCSQDHPGPGSECVPDPSAFLDKQDSEEEATGVAAQLQSSDPPALNSAWLHEEFAGPRVKEARC
jgi:hypothetical protein